MDLLIRLGRIFAICVHQIGTEIEKDTQTETKGEEAGVEM